jgi:acyl-CoA thioester hydrolase
MYSAFSHLIKVPQGDIDELGHVNNVVYVRYVQEVAAAHWHSVADEQLKQKYLWVVLRHEIDYKHPAFLNDVIRASTWVGDYNGARFDRFVKLVIEESGKVIAEAKTTWCMLDAKSKKPIRIQNDVLTVLGVTR